MEIRVYADASYSEELQRGYWAFRVEFPDRVVECSGEAQVPRPVDAEFTALLEGVKVALAKAQGSVDRLWLFSDCQPALDFFSARFDRFTKSRQSEANRAVTRTLLPDKQFPLVFRKADKNNRFDPDGAKLRIIDARAWCALKRYEWPTDPPTRPTLGDYRALCVALAGEDSAAVAYLDKMIRFSRNGAAERVRSSDATMRLILFPMFKPRWESVDQEPPDVL